MNSCKQGDGSLERNWPGNRFLLVDPVVCAIQNVFVYAAGRARTHCLPRYPAHLTVRIFDLFDSTAGAHDRSDCNIGRVQDCRALFGSRHGRLTVGASPARVTTHERGTHEAPGYWFFVLKGNRAALSGLFATVMSVPCCVVVHGGRIRSVLWRGTFACCISQIVFRGDPACCRLSFTKPMMIFVHLLLSVYALCVRVA